MEAEDEPAFVAQDGVPESGASIPDSLFAARGPYAVGSRNYMIREDTYAIDATIWYPATNPSGVPEEITYKIGVSNPYFPGRPVKGQAIQDADPDTADGPFPLVTFSAGLASYGEAASYLFEHLASHGFVVISSDPRGENLERFYMGAATRPLDTNRLIAFADELTAVDGDLAGLIDTEHIAVTGASSGGWTALVGGGAQFDWSWCDANPDLVAKTELSNCREFVPHQATIASLLGLDPVPTGTWPQINDPRVDAVIAMAPDGDVWGADYQGVAGVQVPTLVMAGSADSVNPPEYCAYPIYEHLGSAKKSLVVLEMADHYVYLNPCRDTMWLDQEFAMSTLCQDPAWDMDRAHDLIRHFTTAFLLAELKGDAEAAAALAPENVAFPKVRYETTGYGETPAP